MNAGGLGIAARIDLSRTDVQNTGHGLDRVIGVEDVTGSAYGDRIIGSGDANRLWGYEDSDTISGAAGKDWLSGGNDNDSLLGGAGDDTLKGGSGNDTLDGGDGFDFASYAASAGVSVSLAKTLQDTGGAGTDKLASIEGLIGSSNNDRLIGNDKANALFGGYGADTLEGGLGADTLHGGEGGDDGYYGDWVFYSSAAAAVTANLELGKASGGAGADFLVDIENVQGSKFADSLVGDEDGNRFYGGSGDDVLDGADGADGLFGEAGRDKLLGRVGDDSLAGGDGDDLIDGGEGDDQIFGEAGRDKLLGGAGNDHIADWDDLSSSIDTIDGGSGDDFIESRGGVDNVSGGAGDDWILDWGSSGDTLNGATGFDVLDFWWAVSGVSVDLTKQAAQNTGAGGTDQILGFEGLSGGKGNDVFIGGATGNLLRGMRGNDKLDGGAGNDTLEGGLGVDTILGGAGRDRVSYDSAVGSVTVTLSTAASGGSSAGADGKDKLFAVEDVTGSSFADTIKGDGNANALDGYYGHDKLYGEAGSDRLTGGGGADTLRGGAGSDRFIYLSVSDSTIGARDLIEDWSVGDIIDLSAIDAINRTGSDDAFQIVTVGGDAGDLVISYNADSNKTLIQLYVDDDAHADAVIVLTGEKTLTAADFSL